VGHVTARTPEAGGAASAQERLQAIYARARASFAEHLAVIDAAVAHLADGRLEEHDREAAERAAHRLAGTAGTVGYPHATAPARELEDAFAGQPGGDQADRLGALAAALRSALAGDAPGTDEDL
jgi:HPt (histidine-containing phosphotransfer) domain-containing protein